MQRETTRLHTVSSGETGKECGHTDEGGEAGRRGAGSVCPVPQVGEWPARQRRGPVEEREGEGHGCSGLSWSRDLNNNG